MPAPLPALSRRLLRAACFAVASCAAVGPDYHPPQVAAPAQWHAELQDGLHGGAIDPRALAEWWTKLDDPLLTQLLERAAAANLDLGQARTRVRQARARRGVAGAALFPTADATGAATWSERGSGQSGAGSSDQWLYSAGFDAAWELDVFGGVRRSVEAAQADLEASREDLGDVLVSLLAETALDYVDLRSAQAQLAIAEANVEAQTETYQIANEQFRAGLTTDLAAEQAQYNLESTRAQIPTFRTQIEQLKNALSVLTGQPPGALDAELDERKQVPVPPGEVLVGVPANAVRRRPDVRRAERLLAAQTARIGVATADLYPKLSLNGTIGIDASTLGGLTSFANRFSQLGPSFKWTLFAAGSIRQNIELQEALTEETLLAYQQAVLKALQEVEDDIVAYAQEQQRRDSLSRAAAAAERAVTVARQQFETGLVDFQSVLDAQRSLLSLQEQLEQSDAAVTSNLIRLYKALGGGWTPAG